MNKQPTSAPAEQQKKNKKMMWYTLAFMGFTTVWGFGNIINGFAYYGGLPAVVPWVLIMALYFVPYALIVGELGATFKESGGGVSSWTLKTTAPVFAFFAGWMYWVVHMPYLSQKPNQVLVAASWAIFGEKGADKIKNLPTLAVALACWAIFLFCIFLTTRGISIIKKIASVAGICSFILSLLFILMIWAAPHITDGNVQQIKWSFDTFKPEMGIGFFTSLSILILAVGGAEKIAPYVNQMKKPGKNFPKGMIAVAVMVAICAVLGTIALGMVTDPSALKDKDHFVTSGAYESFEKLGLYYGVGSLFRIIYAITQGTCFLAALIISIDAPLRVLLDNADTNYIPKGLLRKTKRGAYRNGLILVVVIVTILMIVPALGAGNNDALNNFLTKMNSVCMPLRYCWVFVAYYFLKKRFSGQESDYKFLKNKYLGMTVAGWCFLLTLISCIMGMYTTNKDGTINIFQTVSNVIVPIVLVCLGFVMMAIARKQNNK